MTKSTGTALARTPAPEAKEAAAEKLPASESLTLPAALLLAAESISANDKAEASQLHGVYLHARDGKGRVVGTDGVRMFLASFALPPKAQGGPPAWMKDGVILSNDGLRARIQLLRKLGDDPDIRIGFAKGATTAEVTDLKQQTAFKVKVVDGAYPDYEKALGSESFASLDDEGRVTGKEWQPIGINSVYLKQCGELAKTLEMGLAKDQRSKLGMVIRAFNSGDPKAPMVFDFSTWPGAVLVVSPTIMASSVTSKETAQLLQPAVKATIAALRAHATRNIAWAGETEDPDKKAEFLRKAEEFKARVANVLRTVPSGPALQGPAPKPEAGPAPEPEPTPEPEPQPEPEDEPEPEPEADRPTVTRTRVAA